MNFTEENIAAIFGHESAEDEDIDRLKAYYLMPSRKEKVRQIA